MHNMLAMKILILLQKIGFPALLFIFIFAFIWLILGQTE